ncbi:MAG TPA: hypothetical protein PLG43_03375 [Spirochaetia bacterium]|nr:hypothetical protein [Spirochaetia bacterium]
MNMGCDWKKNWNESRTHYEAWWRREGLVASIWGNGIIRNPCKGLSTSMPAHSSLAHWNDAQAFAAAERSALAEKEFPLDIVPFVYTDYGTVSLAPLLGSPIHFGKDTIWYSPSGISPDNDYELKFDPDHPFWKNLCRVVEESMKRAGDDYFVGAPAFAPGLDVLAELRGTAELMTDLIYSPDWVHSKLREIQSVSYTAIEELYPLLRNSEGILFHAFFMFCSSSVAALAQCDSAALISPDMFEEFCLPYLQEYCSRFDNVLYHVDGPDALRTVDMLLEVENLRAIEFTPGPQVPSGDDPCWYGLYKKILKAGKSVQAVWIKPDTEGIRRLLDAVGPKGMYLEIEIETASQADQIERALEPYR